MHSIRSFNNPKIDTTKHIPTMEKIQVTNSSDETTPEVKQPADPCKNVKIDAIIKSRNASSDQDNGQILIQSTTVKGGHSPYQYSLDNEVYKKSFSFKDLPSGQYSVFIKDKNNCTSKVKEVIVEKSLCISGYKKTFNPEYDLNWEIPQNSESESNFTFQLVSSKGETIINEEMDIFTQQSWDGKNSNGELAAPGYYKFIIEYPYETCTGDITLFR